MWRAVLMACLCAAKTAMADPTGFIDAFHHISPDWHVANYDFDHPSFATDWRTKQVVAKRCLWLSLTPQKGRNGRFSGGSIRRLETSHYGQYEVVMQATKGDGLVTGFFTYTGPHYGTRHDEIDIEFLGRDTTQMHIAWFVDGKLTNHFIDLGFDAAEELHHYAFIWRHDKLQWYVDGKLVFEHLAKDGAIPQTPGRLFANIWAADHSISNWAGAVHPDTRGHAHVVLMRFTPLT